MNFMPQRDKIAAKFVDCKVIILNGVKLCHALVRTARKIG